ncbi:lipoprotein, partial [Desulfobacula sp.]|nr:lipoprotein [Desulfobacula sp.]
MKKLFLLFAIVLLLSGCSLFESSNEMSKTAEELV